MKQRPAKLSIIMSISQLLIYFLSQGMHNIIVTLITRYSQKPN